MEARTPLLTTALACGICGKLFTTIPAHKRHVAYCSRAQRRPRKRQRSCLSCNLAKHKCSFGQPCTRCAQRAIDCLYEPSRYKQPSQPPMPASVPSSSEDSKNSKDRGLCLLNLNDEADTLPFEDLMELYHNLSDGIDVSSTALVLMGTLLPGLSPCSAPVIEGFTDDKAVHVSADDLYSSIMCRVEEWSTNPESQLKVRASMQSLLRNQIPRSAARIVRPMSHAMTVRALDVVRNTAGYERTKSIILDSLHAFPYMMLRRKTFPSIIHQHWHPKGQLPPALTSCMDIAEQFASSPRGQRQEVWNSIIEQQELFRANIESVTKRNIIAQIQADSMYVVMQAVDGPGASPVVNLGTLRCHQMMCIKAISMIEFESMLLMMSPHKEPSWEEWVFDESRRRLACLWLIISRVVDIRDGIWCPGIQGCRELPLPAPRALWEARSEQEWQDERAEIEAQPALAITTVGDLIDAKHNGAAGHRQLANWYAGCDSLGHLFNLAISLF